MFAGGLRGSCARQAWSQRKWNGRAPQGQQLYDDVTSFHCAFQSEGARVRFIRSSSSSVTVSLESGRYRRSGRFGSRVTISDPPRWARVFDVIGCNALSHVKELQ
jgi:hypothetical protein